MKLAKPLDPRYTFDMVHAELILFYTFINFVINLKTLSSLHLVFVVWVEGVRAIASYFL